jgi:hypothetical protein
VRTAVALYPLIEQIHARLIAAARGTAHFCRPIDGGHRADFRPQV